MFNSLVGSLQAQVVLGPLAGLKQIGGGTAPKINSAQYVAGVDSIVQGFEAAAEQEVPTNRQLNKLVQLQGTALDAQTSALYAKLTYGLESNTPAAGTTSGYYNDNLVTVEHLTLSRPLWPYGTPILNYIGRTEVFETDLTSALGIISKVGIGAAANLAQTEASSFTADINLSMRQRPSLDTFMNSQTGILLTQIEAAAQSGPSGAGAFVAAVQNFTTATYSPITGAGYLGPHGVYGRNFVQPTTANQVPSATTPLSYTTGNTFSFGRYTVKRLRHTVVYHRNFSDTSNEYGKYVTTSLFPNSAVAIRKSALDQTFLPPNTAIYVEDVSVGAGHYVYVGRVAPIYQGVLASKYPVPGTGPPDRDRQLVRQGRGVREPAGDWNVICGCCPLQTPLGRYRKPGGIRARQLVRRGRYNATGRKSRGAETQCRTRLFALRIPRLKEETAI